ncbi:trypco2 family protein [Ruegeria sp. HKCCA6837]|uniref:trypco2 family protein n=1 Tax=Ruegeria sp. HKCCA6837 TaxID=2682989 RepID=UPI0014881355|nr:trypco2 family protein [Ruegeria sp. HKCCA6837]
MTPITIRDAMEELRTQIRDAQEPARDDDISFEITEAQVQIRGSFTRSREASGAASVKFSVFGFGAGAGGDAGMSQGRDIAHTVTLSLKVTDARSGGSVRISTEQSGDF